MVRLRAAPPCCAARGPEPHSWPSSPMNAQLWKAERPPGAAVAEIISSSETSWPCAAWSSSFSFSSFLILRTSLETAAPLREAFKPLLGGGMATRDRSLAEVRHEASSCEDDRRVERAMG